MANGTQDGIIFRGSIPAIVTPMHEDGSLDLPAFRKLIDWHVEEGTDALVVVGTSGESATLSVEEHILMVKTAVEHTAGRIPVIAGSGGNSTAEAIELTERAKAVGADATLQVVPYYNKPTQEASIATSARLPRRWTCRSSCTTCRGVRWPICRTRRFCVSPTCPASWG